MYRLMQPSDEAAVLALWQSQHHDTEDFAKMVLERFAGVQNIYVADENDAIVAAALGGPGNPAGCRRTFKSAVKNESQRMGQFSRKYNKKSHRDNKIKNSHGRNYFFRCF